MSEVKSKFDMSGMVIKGKENFANRLAGFVLQGVPENKHRHEEVQRFFIANDSVTVATEVPVFIRKDDVAHMERVLKFTVTGADVEDAEVESGTRPNRERGYARKEPAASGSGAVNIGSVRLKGRKRPVPFPEIMTGHIDLVQVRNGVVHLLDYKPGAAKEKPVEQLTWYALALSRRTGLRLLDFKCAWFDEKDYFEFYPLHVVKKLQRKRTKKVRYKDGTVAVLPKDNAVTIV